MESRIQRQARQERTAIRLVLSGLALFLAIRIVAGFLLPQGHLDTERMFTSISLGADIDDVRTIYGGPEQVETVGHWCGNMPDDHKYVYWDDRHRMRRLELTFCYDDELYLAELVDGDRGVVKRLGVDQDLSMLGGTH